MGLHMEFLWQVTGKHEKRQLYGTWWQEGAESVLKAKGVNTISTYINKRQATVVQWVVLQPIFEVCA